jgi:hypothetical protein
MRVKFSGVRAATDQGKPKTARFGRAGGETLDEERKGE